MRGSDYAKMKENENYEFLLQRENELLVINNVQIQVN